MDNTLFKAIKAKDFKKFESELVTNEDVDKFYECEGFGCPISALTLALSELEENDDIQFVDALLKKGADVNAKCFNEDITPIFEAVESENINAFDLLKHKGARLYELTSEGDSILSFAISSNNIDMVNTVLQSEVLLLVNHIGGIPKESPLVLAIEMKNFKIVELLLLYGADPTLSNLYVKPALNYLPKDLEEGESDLIKIRNILIKSEALW